MKKALSGFLALLVLVAMLSVIGLNASAAVSPDGSKLVLDLSYLTKDTNLASPNAVVFWDQAFNNDKQTISAVTKSDKDWLKIDKVGSEYLPGLLVNLLTAKGQNPAKGLTDWTGGTILWMYVSLPDNRGVLDLQLYVDNGDTGSGQGFFTSKNQGVDYYVQKNGSYEEKTIVNDNNDWGHMYLDEGYEGWLGVELANLGCVSGHLTDQTMAGHMSKIYGVGLYSEVGTVYFRDIRVSGLSAGLDDPKETTTTTMTTTSAAPATTTAATPTTTAAGETGDPKPANTKPLVDLSFLPAGKTLVIADGVGGVFSDNAVTAGDLLLSRVSGNGKDWLQYERTNTNWNAGIYVDLLKGKAADKAVTDWTGATTLWFYAKAEAATYLNLVLAVDNENSGAVQGFFNSEENGFRYTIAENGAFVEKTTTEDTYKHILLPAGYEGWVGIDLSQLACRSGHLSDQTIAGHLAAIYGVGFYMEGGKVQIGDFCAEGIAKGLETEAPVSSATTSATAENPVTGGTTATVLPIALLAIGMGIAAVLVGGKSCSRAH